MFDEIPFVTPAALLMLAWFVMAYGPLILCLAAVLEAWLQTLVATSASSGRATPVWAPGGGALLKIVTAIVRIIMAVMGRGGGHGVP